MFRTSLLAWIAALSFTLVGAQESWAQKGRGSAGRASPHVSGGKASYRPSVTPYHPHVTGGSKIVPAYRTAPALHTSPTWRPGVITQAHWQGGAGVWQGGTKLANHHIHGGIWEGNRRHHAFEERRRLLFLSSAFAGPWLYGYGASPWLYPYGGYSPFGYPYYDDPYLYNDPFYYGGTPQVVLPAGPVGDVVAHLQVILPDPDADVWFSGYKTSSRGTSRSFDSPNLKPGSSYSYTITASWNQGGQVVSAEAVVPVTAGSRVVVDFTQNPVQVRPAK
jgi:uncharacterized protein (TIGR03000 family)